MTGASVSAQSQPAPSSTCTQKRSLGFFCAFSLSFSALTCPQPSAWDGAVTVS